MHEEENSSTRCLIKHQNEFRRNRREAVFLFAAYVRLWHSRHELFAPHMSAFGGKADIGRYSTVPMSAIGT